MQYLRRDKKDEEDSIFLSFEINLEKVDFKCG